jgi:hypothetical protein
MVLRWLVQLLYPSQKFERPPFWNVAGTALKIKASRSLSMVWYLYRISKENLPIGSKVDKGDKHTDRMVISLAYMFPLGRKVGLKCFSYKFFVNLPFERSVIEIWFLKRPYHVLDISLLKVPCKPIIRKYCFCIYIQYHSVWLTDFLYLSFVSTSTLLEETWRFLVSFEPIECDTHNHCRTCWKVPSPKLYW